METLTIALWATNLEPPLGSLEDWIARVEARMAEAHTAGAGLLVLPEFACAQWLSFAPPDLGAQNEVPWLGEIAEHALAAMRPLPARYNMALLPGTMPFAIPDRGDGKPGHLNRAWLLLPDGQAFAQDKIALTPSEQNPAGWHLTPGTQVNVIPWLGLRVAIIICLDIEFTELFARIAKLDLDLILVPAKVDMLAGYYRVIGSAKARAIELQTVVAAVGAVGSPLGQPAVDTVVGAAVVFLPCETSLGSTGVAAALDPLPAATGASPVLYAYHVPLGACRRIRHGAAEAESGRGPGPPTTSTSSTPPSRLIERSTLPVTSNAGLHARRMAAVPRGVSNATAIYASAPRTPKCGMSRAGATSTSQAASQSSTPATATRR